MSDTPVPKGFRVDYGSGAPVPEEPLDMAHKVAIPRPPLVPIFTLPAEAGPSGPPSEDSGGGKQPPEGGRKFDGGKARYDLLPTVIYDALRRYVVWKGSATGVTIHDLRTEEGVFHIQHDLANWRRMGQAHDGLDALSWTLGLIAEAHGEPEWNIFRKVISLLNETSKVLTYGARKYDDNNWQIVPKGEPRYYSAMVRHLTDGVLGPPTDEETGLSHLAHAACNVAFLLGLRDGVDAPFDHDVLVSGLPEESAAE